MVRSKLMSATFGTLTIAGLPYLAMAQTTTIPTLSPIEQDNAVPEIEISKTLYARLTAENWRAETKLSAKVGKGSHGYARYPNHDVFCREVKGPSEFNFELTGKTPVPRITLLRIEEIDCSSVSQNGALIEGLYVMDNGAIGVGKFRFANSTFSIQAGIKQDPQRSIVVTRLRSDGNTEIAAVAGSDGTTLLTTENEGIFKYRYIRYEQNNYEPVSNPKINARLIIPGLGYIDGRSSRSFIFEVGNSTAPGWNATGTVARTAWGYGSLYAIDDSFRITGPIFFDSQPVTPNFATEHFEESKKPEARRIFLPKYLSAGSLSGVPVFFHPTSDTAIEKAQIYLSIRQECKKQSGFELTETCSTLHIQTRKNTVFGPPGGYYYYGAIDLNKGPELDAMILNPKFMRPDEETIITQMPDKIGTRNVASREVLDRGKAERAAALAKIFRDIDAAWAKDDQVLVQYVNMRAQQYAADFAQLEKMRRQVARDRAEGHAAIMGAISDLNISAQNAGAEMNRSQQQMNQANAAASGSSTPQVFVPANAEAQRILAANWGRNGGYRSKDASPSLRPSPAQSASGRNVGAGSQNDTTTTGKRMTQAEAFQLMTGSYFVDSDGLGLVTNGLFAELRDIPAGKDYGLQIPPFKDMVVTDFRVIDYNGNGPDVWQLKGTATCYDFKKRPRDSKGQLEIDQRTGREYAEIFSCNWLFTNADRHLNAYTFKGSTFTGWHKY